MTIETRNVKRRLINSAKTDSKRVHITFRPNGWAIRKEGNLQASHITTTQREAINIAKEWVREGKASAVIVHNREGKIRQVK